MPLSLAFALTIGWFNGTIVDKTGLPSFIVTLGSYFVLIGAKLSFSKMFVGQVTVAGLDKADGFELLAQGLRGLVDPQRPPLGEPGHALDRARDRRRRARRRRRHRAQLPAGPGPRGLGADRTRSSGSSVGVVGFVGLLNTDGVGANTVFGLAHRASGSSWRVIGWGRWRYDPLRRKGAFQIDGEGRPATR